jgi:hypothetical protein
MYYILSREAQKAPKVLPTHNLGFALTPPPPPQLTTTSHYSADPITLGAPFIFECAAMHGRRSNCVSYVLGWSGHS